jgi:hypothetical protein
MAKNRRSPSLKIDSRLINVPVSPLVFARLQRIAEPLIDTPLTDPFWWEVL